MRMWMVNPALMCRQHLLGEHVELHMLVGTLLRKKSIAGFVDNDLIEVHSVRERHSEVVREMQRRGDDPPVTLSCPACGMRLLPPEDDPLAPVIECPACETRFDIEEGMAHLHGDGSDDGSAVRGAEPG